MIVVCPSCSARFQYDEARFQGARSKRFRCPKCGHVFEAENPAFQRATTSLVDEELLEVSQNPPPPPGNQTGTVAFKVPEPDPLDPKETTARRGRETMMGDAGICEAGLPPGLRVSLAFLTGPNASMVKVLDSSRIVIGREEGDIITRDPETSRRHAALEIHMDGTVWITDLNSTNGTTVEGEALQGTIQILDRQEFTCGKSTFMLLIRKEDSYLD